MFLRALFAFLACPGTVALAIPIAWIVLSGAELEHPAALVNVALGLAGLLVCVRDFYVAGKGTLAPWAPPQHLVVVGLYRYTRNPMYIAVTFMLFGWAGAFESARLAVYTIAVLVAFHLRVVYGEEPKLKQVFATEWEAYAARVPRWLW